MNLIIPAIQNIQGEVVTTTKEINKVFHDFYAGLYLSEMNPSPDKIDAFFSKINLPKLTKEQGKQLDVVITEQEVRDAVLPLKVGKSPGLDGFPVEYYKRFINTLAPILTNVYTEAFSSGKLPDTFSEALISLINKKNKDPTDPGSFCPISLINVDSKIITQILATRLERVMAHLIHTGQVGFVRGRASSDNVRRLLHLDRVEWGFLVHTLRRFGFGDGFIKWVRVIYSNPKASLLTNGLMSPFFNLTRSSKQGDPLSPLLFILFLEPLAAVLRAETCIKGVWGGGCENKLFMYADDILLLVSDPAKSVPLVLDQIEEFSKISGYKINWHKSEVMPVSRTCFPSIVSSFQFKWVPVSMKYLGIRLSADLESILELNMATLLQKIKNNLEKWKVINLSLWGKINTTKMAIVPQFNYISMMLPLIILDRIFKQYNQIVKDFLWNGKRPRINIKKMYSHRKRGGLVLPNVETYKLSFELAKLARHWAGYDSGLGWVQIEKSLTAPFTPIQALSQKRQSDGNKNPILMHSNWVWAKTRRILGRSQYKQAYSSTWNNPQIHIGKRPVMWDNWQINNICIISDLCRDKFLTFKTYQELAEEFGLERKGDSWKYVQLQSSIRSTFKCNEGLEDNMLQKIFNSPKMMHSASIFYQNLTDIQSASCENLRLIWQKDLGRDIGEKARQNIISNVGWASRDIRSKASHYKIIHRYYYTPLKLYRMGLLQDRKCWKCNTFLHAMWECPSVLPFWKEVLKKLGEIVHESMPESPELYLLGNKEFAPQGVTTAQSELIPAGSLIAARLVLRNWKNSSKPRISEWIKLLTETASFERLIAKVNNMEGKFQQVWEPYLLHLYAKD